MQSVEKEAKGRWKAWQGQIVLAVAQSVMQEMAAQHRHPTESAHSAFEYGEAFLDEYTRRYVKAR